MARPSNMARFLSKVSFPGILVGGLVDVLLSILLAIAMAITMSVIVNLQHPSSTHRLAFLNAALRSLPFVMSKVLGGLACSVLGGYIAARIARGSELLNGTLSSACCIVVGGLLILFGKSNSSHGPVILAFLSSPLCGLVGGYLRLRQKSPVAAMPR